MGRFGLLPDEVLPFVERLAALPGVMIEGLFSHFAVADSADKTYTRQQFAIFQDVRARLDSAGVHVPLCHIANSAATLDLPEMHLDAVRCGIAIYGLHPSNEVEPAVPLKPALTLKSRVARVRTLPAGSSISYGRTYITPRAMPVALIPVGYGDGYHRLLSNRAAVLINGQRAPIVGRVCMDQFVVDCSGVGPVQVNDEVVLIGCQGDACIPAEEVARWAETINYEVTTALLPRAPRVYTGGGSKSLHQIQHLRRKLVQRIEHPRHAPQEVIGRAVIGVRHRDHLCACRQSRQNAVIRNPRRRPSARWACPYAVRSQNKYREPVCRSPSHRWTAPRRIHPSSPRPPARPGSAGTTHPDASPSG